jgi:hypothetical protein
VLQRRRHRALPALRGGRPAHVRPAPGGGPDPRRGAARAARGRGHGAGLPGDRSPFPEGELHGVIEVVEVDELISRDVTRIIVRDPERRRGRVHRARPPARPGRRQLRHRLHRLARHRAPRASTRPTGWPRVARAWASTPPTCSRWATAATTSRCWTWAGPRRGDGPRPAEVSLDRADAVTGSLAEGRPRRRAGPLVRLRSPLLPLPGRGVPGPGVGVPRTASLGALDGAGWGHAAVRPRARVPHRARRRDVKQLNPFTGTEVWTVPGRGNRPLGLAHPDPRPLDPDAAGAHCAFCEAATTRPRRRSRASSHRRQRRHETLYGRPGGADVRHRRGVPARAEPVRDPQLRVLAPNYGYTLPVRVAGAAPRLPGLAGGPRARPERHRT